jgi:hypothetical protein
MLATTARISITAYMPTYQNAGKRTANQTHRNFIRTVKQPFDFLSTKR